MDACDLIWKNGEFVPWDDAKVHVLTHGLHYGTGVFEGIRAYETERGPAVFRLPEHLDRLEKSAELYYLQMPYDAEELRAATKELIARNGLSSCYIRPLAFRGYGEMGLYANSAPIDVIIATWPWGAYLGDESAGKGIRAKVSSWRRISPAGAIPHSKASGSYLNSILAKTESAKAGYDEAILLDERGFVCEGSGENIFVVRDGEILTPPHVASILDGISRKSVIQIARDLGYTVVERDIARAELYLAEEVFMTGTAAEMVPVREIDDHDIGGPGEITLHLQAKFMDALHGRADEYLEWLDFVDVAPETPTAGRDGAKIGAEEIESTDETIGRITPAA
ncbi:MAG TPA: branched-chain amino acid transaminase [Solirubrobacterales bacterium]|nr:branched-chain amino acid transaminase [Solirubrobacterales bacterium]